MVRNELTLSTTNETNASAEIKVTIHLPEDVSEVVKQQKINHLYDVLKPKPPKHDSTDAA
ncbi:MAG: hypothetical protein J6I46_15130 [Ruminococcus sp.]|nr:hypothetical protein [Ruminiclostridium sp.]MBP3799091.1 hypothetical protein [Ruminococcus sp.]